MEEATIDEKLLTSEDLAARYGVTVRTIKSWRARHTGPPSIKVGDEKAHTVRYRLSDVLAWEEARIRGGDVA